MLIEDNNVSSFMICFKPRKKIEDTIVIVDGFFLSELLLKRMRAYSSSSFLHPNPSVGIGTFRVEL